MKIKPALTTLSAIAAIICFGSLWVGAQTSPPEQPDPLPNEALTQEEAIPAQQEQPVLDGQDTPSPPAGARSGELEDANNAPNDKPEDSAAAPSQAFIPDEPTATIRVLEKISLRTAQFQMTAGQVARFGRLAIQLKTCQTYPPEQLPQSGAFLQIDETPLVAPGRQARQKRIFSGWMFAQNPSINALEHPVYDVWVMSCTMRFPETGPDTVVVGRQAVADKRATGSAQEDADARSGETTGSGSAPAPTVGPGIAPATKVPEGLAPEGRGAGAAVPVSPTPTQQSSPPTPFSPNP